MFRSAICVPLVVAGASHSLAQTSSSGAVLAASETHVCVVDTGTGWFPDARPAASGRAAADSAADPRNRIDLSFQLQPPTAGALSPSVTAHAINSKGTGASRKGVAPGGPITVSCTKSASDGLAHNAASRAAGVNSHAAASGWSCTVEGSERAPRFILTLVVSPPSGPEATNWSFGASNSSASSRAGEARMAIVPHGLSGAEPVATCASKQKGGKAATYDLAKMTKA